MIVNLDIDPETLEKYKLAGKLKKMSRKSLMEQVLEDYFKTAQDNSVQIQIKPETNGYLKHRQQQKLK